MNSKASVSKELNARHTKVCFPFSPSSLSSFRIFSFSFEGSLNLSQNLIDFPSSLSSFLALSNNPSIHSIALVVRIFSFPVFCSSLFNLFFELFIDFELKHG